MDLFTIIAPPKDLHPNFVRLLDEHSAADREVISQWADGFKDRDGKFVREFQTSFNSGFWELYLFACAKELGFHVNLAFPSPDFVIDDFHNEFCIEAVIASNADGEPAEWEKDVSTQPPPEEVLKTAVIRLSNAISSKYKKFLNSYQKLSHVVKRPFVLAVGPFEQPDFWAQNDHAIRMVLYTFDRKLPDGTYRFQNTVAKPSGSVIELGLFTDRRMSEVSAVIFSNTATLSKVHALNSDLDTPVGFSSLRFNHHGPEPFLWNAMKPEYRESLLDGLYVFHNPHALFPLPPSYFDHSDISQGTLLPGEKVPRYKCKHGHLIQRSSMTIRAKEETEGERS
jgi:hypothetical protein